MHFIYWTGRSNMFSKFWGNKKHKAILGAFWPFLAILKVWNHKITTGCSRWMCRILDWYGGYAFRLWEILKWFPSHTDVYIWLSSEMFGIFRWIKSEKLFFPILVKNDQFLKKFDQNWKQKFFLIFLYQNKCTLGR